MDQDLARRLHDLVGFWPLRMARLPVWPIDEFLSRHKRLGLSVKARLRRMNPDGVEEGNWPRGWFPERHRRMAGSLDVFGPKEFIKRYGRAAYRAVPKSAIHRRGHRKGISFAYAAFAGLKAV